MTQPPAKRQKTLPGGSKSANKPKAKVRPPGSGARRFVFSDDIDKENQDPKRATRASSGKNASGPADAESPSKSPSKSTQTIKPGRSGPLDNLFRAARNKPRVASKDQLPSVTGLDKDDAILDDFSDEEVTLTQRTRGLPAGRPTAKVASHSLTGRAFAFSGGIKGSGLAQQHGENASLVSTARPWVEAFEPENSDELAVHKKKVDDVRSWLSNVLSGRERKSLLVLEGPAGCGKTATIRALSKELEFELLEWSNPTDSSMPTERYTSMASRFDEFLSRGGHYSSLEAVGSQLRKGEHASAFDPEKSLPKVIVMKEFPVTLPFREESLHAFRQSVLGHLVRGYSGASSLYRSPAQDFTLATPIVMVISESRTGASIPSSDSLTAHRLLGQDILKHRAATSIEFNPAAPTMITKALELVTRKEARLSGRRRIPGREVLKALSDLGDLRNAIGCFEMLCRREGKDSDWSGTVAATKSNKSGATKATKMEQDAIRTITLRDTNITLFHAAGKVLYNKRITPANLGLEIERPLRPPDHLSHHARPNVSEVAVERLMEEAGTDSSTFVTTLHENFVLSCNSDDSVDVIDDCLGMLSDSDLLSPGTGRYPNGPGSGRMPPMGGGANEYLLQDEISFHAAVSGLLFALPYPVKRGSGRPGQARGRDDFKMFYPASLRLWKQVDRFKSSIGRLSRLHRQGTPTHVEPELGQDGDSTDPASHNGGSTAMAQELMQERMPYLAVIERARRTKGEPSELDGLMQFHGVDLRRGDNEDSNNGPDALKGSSRPGGPSQAANKSLSDFQSSKEVHERLENIAGKLVLSDDDIEDE